MRSSPLLSFDYLCSFFIVKLAFAFTINKSQGQSLNTTKLLLYAVFDHGQMLYVACSRWDDTKNLNIYCENGRTMNIIYVQSLKQWFQTYSQQTTFILQSYNLSGP